MSVSLSPFSWACILMIDLLATEGQAEDFDIGQDHELKITGFAATSLNTGAYGQADRDLYSITDMAVHIRYQACQFNAYAYNEPYYGPPHSTQNTSDFSEANLDCALTNDDRVHGYVGRFQNFDRGNAEYFYGLADGGQTIGNYAVFRQSPMIYYAVADQDGVGLRYNFDNDVSVIGRVTYTDLDDRTMDLKPTYSTRLNAKFFGLKEEFEIARVGAFNATQAAATLWGEQPLTEDLKLQAAGVLIVERTALETKKIWETVSGLTGKINSDFQWKGGIGTIGQTNLGMPNNFSGYCFGGLSHDLNEHFEAAVTLTQTEPLFSNSAILPSTVGMFMISYRMR